MNSLPTTATLVVLTVVLGCSKPPPPVELTEGDILDGVYRNERLGWKFPIPKDCTALSKSEIKRLEDVGHEAIADTLSHEYTSYHVPLLYLRKGQSNVFASAAQAYDPKKHGDYREQQQAVFDVLLNAYRSQDIPIESQRSEERIDGLVFDVLEVTIYTNNKKTILLRQCYYDRLINDRSLMVSIIYHNERDKQALLEALRQSKFLSKARTQKTAQPDK